MLTPNDRYASLGVDVKRAMQRLRKVPISLHCWQGDDVGGFENCAEESRCDRSHFLPLLVHGPVAGEGSGSAHAAREAPASPA